MTINKVQAFFKKLLERVAHPRIGSVISIQEEVGKLSKTVMDIEIYGENIPKSELEDNCANLFISVVDICNSYGIELEKITTNKIKEIEKKVSSWEKKHGAELRRKRERFDIK